LIQLIQSINNSSVPILAVDVPSGLNRQRHAAERRDSRDGDGHNRRGQKGLLKVHASPFVGRLEVVSMSVLPYPFETELLFSDCVGFCKLSLAFGRRP